MAVQSWPAAGTTLSYSTDVGVTWVPIGEVTNISHAGGGEVGERDTSHLLSTSKTAAPTIPDNGELTFDLNWDPTDTAHIQLMSWKNSPPTVLPQFKVVFATTVTHSAAFSGFVKNIDGPNAGGIDDNLVASVTLRVSGAVTIV